MTVTLPDVWDLQADTGYLDTAKLAWQTLATDFGTEATNQRNREAELRLNWECAMADTYFAHAEGSAGIVPGKFFEYIAIGTPILLVPSETRSPPLANGPSCVSSPDSAKTRGPEGSEV